MGPSTNYSSLLPHMPFAVYVLSIPHILAQALLWELCLNCTTPGL